MSAEPGVVERYFAAEASFWEQVYGQASVFSAGIHRRHAMALTWIERLDLEPGTPVLEVGCGAGLLAASLARRGLAVDAIDPVPGMVVRARRRAEEMGVDRNLRVRVGDVNRLDFDDDRFTVVVALGVLPWLDSPADAVREMSRVLKPGGFLVLSADNRCRLIWLLDPARNPALDGVKASVKAALDGAGARPGCRPRADRRKQVDRMLRRAGLRKVADATCGFGPLTFFWRRLLPDRVELGLERKLQALADRGLPGIRSAGWHHLVLAEKRVAS